MKGSEIKENNEIRKNRLNETSGIIFLMELIKSVNSNCHFA